MEKINPYEILYCCDASLGDFYWFCKNADLWHNLSENTHTEIKKDDSKLHKTSFAAFTKKNVTWKKNFEREHFSKEIIVLLSAQQNRIE